MPRRKTLAALIQSEGKLRKQDERWERDRRREDREDRKVKDEELNGVRLQLRDQASGFATKDMVYAMQQALDAKVETLEKSLEASLVSAIDRLNTEGTSDSREANAERSGREDATKEILASIRQTSESSATNRRWLIGLVVTIGIAILANLATFVTLLSHLSS